MSGFEDRQKGFENKFKHDQELQFKVTARRNKLLGQWVAGKLGLSGAAADDYAKTVVAADFAKPGDDDVIDKVLADLSAKGVTLTKHDIARELTRLADEAKSQVMKQA